MGFIIMVACGVMQCVCVFVLPFLAHAVRVCRPAGFGALTLLTSLSLSTNKLALVPSCLHHLTLLRTLRIANNTIQNLPVALFGSLKMLEILDCQGNQVRSSASSSSGHVPDSGK